MLQNMTELVRERNKELDCFKQINSEQSESISEI